jgi:hypothetical protein
MLDDTYICVITVSLLKFEETLCMNKQTIMRVKFYFMNCVECNCTKITVLSTKIYIYTNEIICHKNLSPQSNYIC